MRLYAALMSGKISPKPCPHCGRPAAWEGNPWRPFCSERCRMIDLGRWASGEYRIPGEPIRKEGAREEGDKEKKK